MNTPLAPIQLPAVALNLLQTRSAAIDAVVGPSAAEPDLAHLQPGKPWPHHAPAPDSGGSIPRGQFINILV